MTGSPNNAIDLLDAGTTAGVYNDTPSFPLHPPTGMWLIGAGESVFGMNPFGWRISAVLAGTLLVLVVIRLLRRLTGSMLLAAAGGLFLAFDGLEFVMSRVGMLDIFLALFLVSGVGALVADRQWSHQRLRERRRADPSQSVWGPALWWRPWRLAAGIAFGLAIGTKWSGLFVIAAFGLLAVWWDISGRRRLGVTGAVWKSMLIDGVPAFGYLVVVAFGVYVTSWIPWLVHAREIAPALAYPISGGSFWGSWVNVSPHGLWDNVAYAFRALWHFHQDVYRFHTVVLSGQHPLESSAAWGWPILARPFVLFLYHSVPVGMYGCTGSAGTTCSVALLALGTPILWWAGALALIDGAYLMVARGDWRFSVPVAGFAATWLPWLAYGDRPIYSYYAVAMIPFTVVALVLVLERWVTPDGTRERLSSRGKTAVAVVVLLVAANFAWEWPVLTAQPVSRLGYVLRVFVPNWRLGEVVDATTSPTSDGSAPPTSGGQSNGSGP